MSDRLKPTRQNFIDAAIRGDWSWIDANLHDKDITRDDLHWAMWGEGKLNENKDVRDLAATYLNTSSLSIDKGALLMLEGWMESDSYHIVQYRVAIALWKRGHRYSNVVDIMEKACADPDVGELARKYRKAA